MKTVKKYALATLCLLALSGCQTTTSMSAKSAPGEGMSAKNACSKHQNSRVNCDDKSGCGWNNATGTCAAN